MSFSRGGLSVGIECPSVGKDFIGIICPSAGRTLFSPEKDTILFSGFGVFRRYRIAQTYASRKGDMSW